MKTNKKYLTCAAAMIGMLMVTLMGVSPSALRGDDPGYIRKVRTIYTKKLGLEHPSRLAFLPDANAFVVSETPTGYQTRLFVITPYKKLVGVFSADVGLIDPPNLVFDSRSSRLFIHETATNELLEIEALPYRQLPGSPKGRTRFPAGQLGIQQARGLAIDPATGDLFILDSSGFRIIRVRPGQGGDLDLAAALKEGRISSFGVPHSVSMDPRGLAFNPANGDLYLLSPSELKIYALTTSGEIVATLDLSSFGLEDPQGMVFAPSGDPTDDPSNINLYVADTGFKGRSRHRADAAEQASGRIVEFSFAEPMATILSVPTVPATLVKTTQTSLYTPPSPDPAGVTYLSDSNTLLISDCEVDEMSIWFTGVNLYETTLSGSLRGTLTTLPFSTEPTGVTRDPVSRKLFISDDDEGRVWILDPGPDTLYNTSDDSVTSFRTTSFGNYDPEDITFDSWRGHLVIIDGTGAEVYDVSPGSNYVFDGVVAPGDDQVTHFDTAVLGILDPEGIQFNPDTGNLYILSQAARKIAETTIDGTLLRYIDIASLNTKMAAGLTYAPASSSGPSEMNFYIVDRGVDNGDNPSENDGKLYEISLNTPVPATTSLSPTAANGRGPAFTLTVNGSNFASASVVRWNGANRTTTFVSSTRLTAAILTSDLAASGTAQVTVFTPPPGGGSSNAQNFTINNPPAPTISGRSPSSVLAGGADFTLTVTGSNFVQDSVVRWNGSPRTTTVVSSTRLTALIPASDIAVVRTVSITVYTPAPGGGISNSKSLYIGYPVPATTGLSPAAANAGGSAFTLTVNGSNFVAASVVRWKGANRTTTFVSSTQLTAVISAADIATAGTAQVTVYNSTTGGGGGTSNAQTFTINSAQAPIVTSLNPATVNAGGPAFTLTVNGSNFVAGSLVRWNGADRTTTFVSSTQLTAAIPAADIATAATAQVTVFVSGGGTSNALTFTINASQAPTITSLNPATANAGDAAFTLTVNGSNFAAASVVRWNGVDRATTFISSTQLTAAIPAADIATAGTAQVTVFAPGGGTSNAQTFTINNPVPATTSLSPAAADAGGAAFTLTVTGTNFVAGSVVRWNGANRTTTFISSTQLTAAIPAADIAAAGTAQVTVLNPAPGGGTSNAQTFTINGSQAPTITSLDPATANAGGAAFTLTVNGSNFVADSLVRWNGADRATTFISSTQLTAAIPAADIATAGTAQVTVFAPGGGTSNAQTFTINGSQAQTITSLSPASVNARAEAFTLSVYGTGFVSSSVIRWNGTDRQTDYVSSTRLKTRILDGEIAVAGTVTVTVFTPSSGGGSSNALTFTINNPPASTVTGRSPLLVVAGGADFTLTVTGSNFVHDSIVRLNGLPRTTTFVSSTQLMAVILASDIAVVGTPPLTVLTPAPGGGVSNSKTLYIGYPVPTTTGLSPAAANSGGTAFTLTINGTGFVAPSVVRWKGSNRTTTFVSSTQLTAVITAADIATAGTAEVTVLNPNSGGGGGTSNAQTFTIN